MAAVTDTLLTPLWNYLKDAANYIVTLLGKLTFLKTLAIGLIVGAYEWLIDLISPMIPDVSPLTTLLNYVPDSAWYWLDLMAVPFGIKVLIGAYIVKFLIRRIPFIG